MKIHKIKLLLIASIVWLIAGINVSIVGFKILLPHTTPLNILITFIVFVIFHVLIFSKMAKKHTRRILAYKDEKQSIFNFFDAKSYLIMGFMMTLGISVRAFNLLPDMYIGIFYSGLGLSLTIAGFGFLIHFIKASKK